MLKSRDYSKDGKQEILKIYFGQRPTIESLWDGCWNPAYRYKKKLDTLPYYPILEISHNRNNNLITDIEIIFEDNSPIYDPSKPPLLTEPYNWVNPYFWIDMGLYPDTDMRIEDKTWYLNRNYESGELKVPPVDEDFEIIFDDIWKLCTLKQGKASISQGDFTDYIRLIRFLVENVIFSPLEALDFPSLQSYGRQYLEEANGISIYKDSEKLLKGWHITEKDNPEKIKATLLLDIKTIFNLFFEKNKPNDGLSIFLYRIYGSFAEELIKNKLFIRCLHCGLLAEYSQGKKYCSFLTDGKDCGKSARNKRYYSTKGKERLPKYLKTTQDLRALYKERGIKK